MDRLNAMQSIEELRRRLYESMAGSYSPERLQAVRGISHELDHLVVEVTLAQQAEDARRTDPAPRQRQGARRPGSRSQPRRRGNSPSL